MDLAKVHSETSLAAYLYHGWTISSVHEDTTTGTVSEHVLHWSLPESPRFPSSSEIHRFIHVSDVEDKFTIQGRGVVIAPGLPRAKAGLLRKGDVIVLTDYRKVGLLTHVREIELCSPPSPKGWALLLPPDISTEEIMIGMQVWARTAEETPRPPRMITCRRATEDDVERFRHVRLSALKDSPAAFGSTYEAALERSESSWREQLLTTVEGESRNTQFAFFGEECVGIAALYRESGAGSGDLLMMWVAPAFRGTEVASLLVDALLLWAGGVGLQSVFLSVTDTNERAIAFYEKAGFSRTGEDVQVDAERGLRAVRMAKILGP